MTTIRKTYSGVHVDHWVVASDKAATVTVRVGQHGVFCCLSCLSIRCEHCKAVESYVRGGQKQCA